MQWLASHSKKAVGSVLEPGRCLCGVCIFCPCPRGVSLQQPRLPRTRTLGRLQTLYCLSVSVCGGGSKFVSMQLGNKMTILKNMLLHPINPVVENGWLVDGRCTFCTTAPIFFCSLVHVQSRCMLIIASAFSDHVHARMLRIHTTQPRQTKSKPRH